MAKQQVKKNKVISGLLLVVFLVGMIGVLSYLTNGFTGEISTFSVECNGKEISTSANGFETTKENPLKVTVKYVFGGKKVSGYSIKITPNALAGKDFDFIVDGQVYSYQAEKDLTNGFSVEYGESEFTVTPKGNLTEILQAVYPNGVVEDCLEYSYDNMFTLTVNSYNGKSSVLIHFSVPEKVTGINLDKGVIVF